ncbi:hypothetical protein BC831DRAFT_485698 [Entophlyctis helioformis]|nr:hypothetical protein BC831DRAFT_485698 [Entophlyctis helioformis]
MSSVRLSGSAVWTTCARPIQRQMHNAAYAGTAALSALHGACLSHCHSHSRAVQRPTPSAQALQRQYHQQPSNMTKDLVLNVLGSLPTAREARSFLKRFTPADLFDSAAGTLADPGAEPDKNRIGLFSISHGISSDDLRRIVTTLLQLRQLGLFPVVVVSNPPLATNQDVVNHASRVVEAIDVAGGRAIPLCDGIFSIGSAGVFSSVRPIQHALRLGQIPVIACLGFDHAALCRSPVATKSALISLAHKVADVPYLATPIRFIIVNRSGGLRINHSHIPFANLTEDFETLCAQLLGTDPDEMDTVDTAQDLELIYSVLDVLPSTSSAVLTSAATSASLIANIITDKPFNTGIFGLKNASAVPESSSDAASGSDNAQPHEPPTLFRNGLHVERHSSLATVDLARLQTLLEASFQKHLDAKAFFDRLDRVGSCILIAGDYDGAVIVTMERNVDTGAMDLPYLDKFAVAPSSQGMGVADILWSRLKAECPDLSWRSRCSNPVNKWYFERSEGNLALPGGKWTLFWYGPGGLDLVDSYKHMAASIPASFFEKPFVQQKPEASKPAAAPAHVQLFPERDLAGMQTAQTAQA